MEIFQKEVDYYSFLAILKRTTEIYHAQVHAYCLMTNHIHLLLETSVSEIGDIMRKLAGDYAKTYNMRYGYRGHVFEDRYESRLVKEERYFLQLSRYIHMNPVNAHIVAHPEDYKWSSYSTILGKADDQIVVKDRTLSYFVGHEGREYREFVENVGWEEADAEEIQLN